MYYQAQNQFGLTFDQVRKMFPSKSFPADGQIDTPEVSSYAPAPTPDYDPATHAVREAAPVGGVQQWEVYPLPAEEVAANQAAATLLTTDYTVIELAKVRSTIYGWLAGDA